MPHILTSPYSPGLDIGSWSQRDFKYAYPDGLDLKPGSPQHQTILGMERQTSEKDMNYGWK